MHRTPSTLPATCALLLAAASSLSAAPGPLRITPPHPIDGTSPRPLRFAVSPEDGTGITAERAERIDLLGTTNLLLPRDHWLPLEATHSLVEGVLLLEPTTPAPVRFILARETPAPTPPPVLVRTVPELRAAAAAAQPGSRIRIAPGTYPGGLTLANLRGAPGLPITLTAADPAQPPVFQGGTGGIQLSDPAHVTLEDLTFTGATGNGLNIDDGGSLDTPAHHIVLRRLRVADVGPTGNRDAIKLSGVTDFRVEHCTLERWGTGGSGIDMVGCRDGVIEGNTLRHLPTTAAQGANGIQAKGGTRDVLIRRNRLEHAGSRSINIGGSTGLTFFRPPLQEGTDHWEARDIRVEGNTLIGSGAAFAFVGVDGAEVRYNTVYRPDRWAIRILQETTAPGFVPCRNGRFSHNLVVFHSSQWASGGVNIGGNTAPATFSFSNNAWYCLDFPARSRPTLPVPESQGTYGLAPRFRDAEAGDLSLLPDSPARGVGADALPE